MSNLKNKFVMLLTLIFVFAIFASGCSLIQKNPEAIKKQNVAKVGNEYITRAELDEAFAPALEQMKAQYGANFADNESGKSMVESQKKSILDSLVQFKILEQKAKELKVFKDDNEINSEVKKYIDDQLKAYNMTDEQLKTQLEQVKTTREIFEKNVRQQVVIPQKVVEYVTKDETVADDDVKKYYDENKTSITEKPNTMQVSHILLNTEDEAKAVKADLDKGGDFAAIAKEKSIEPAAKESGGSLGEIQYYDPNYDPTFVKAAMDLKEGQISGPVQTQFGFHIIKVTKKTEYPILSFDKAKDSIKEQLLSEKKQTKFSTTMEEWTTKAGVKTYDENINNQK